MCIVGNKRYDRFFWGLALCLVFRCSKDKDKNTHSVTDRDGNSYKTVKIGDQTWMAANLRVTKFCDGTEIPYKSINHVSIPVAEHWDYGTNQPVRCYYNDDASIGDVYGVLYNWYAVADNQCLCPGGWHVPTDTKWQTLVAFLGAQSAGVKLKAKDYWTISNNAQYLGTDEFGFSALPGAARDHNTFSKREIFDIGWLGAWWTSTDNGCQGVGAWYRSMEYDEQDVYRSCSGKGKGLSVRCIKD